MGQIYLLYQFLLLPFSVHSPADSLSYKLIPGIQKTYGYDIFRNGRVLIHQPTVPCMPGMEGFARARDARRVALLVLGKIRNGIMPPSVTLEEMRKAGVNLPSKKNKLII